MAVQDTKKMSSFEKLSTMNAFLNQNILLKSWVAISAMLNIVFEYIIQLLIPFKKFFFYEIMVIHIII